MSKAVRTLIICAYAFLIFQYLRISLHSVTTQIDIKYIYRRILSKAERSAFKKRYHNFTTSFKSFKKPKRFKTDLKFVLKYTALMLNYTTRLHGDGQEPFIVSNCTHYNCYLTSKRDLLNDYRDFDAILFDVENSWDGPIAIREPYQKFIFVASESAARFPVCDDFYESYYNLTWTYRLDSDIQWSFFSILDEKGNHVGPKINMTWIDPMKPTPQNVRKELGGKTKAAAWFVSNCNAKSGRQHVTRQLQEALQEYNLTVDVYGWCGKKKCPKDRNSECLDLLRTNYYFYLPFENSISEDYVTEKILYPLNNYAVPIVFGGADYSRFLPPGSYINARELNATQVVNEMIKAIKNPNVYENYFRWHNYYSFVKDPPDPDVCKLCQILNEDAEKLSWYKHFRKWWNPDFNKICAKGVGNYLVQNPKFEGVLQIERKSEDMKR